MDIFDAVAAVSYLTAPRSVTITDNRTTNLSGLRDHVASLEQDKLRLMAMCSTMWAVLKAKTGATDEELIEHVKAWDPSHSVAAKATAAVEIKVPCQKCGAAITRPAHKCQFCGWEMPVRQDRVIELPPAQEGRP